MSNENILEKIIRHKRVYLEGQKQVYPLEIIMRKLETGEGFKKNRGFAQVLREREGLAVIAEVKKASPSKGIIREDFNPMEIAKAYFSIGVEAISILTETEFFLGRPEYLQEISAVSATPLLRKDFIIDEYQIYESKWLGADAILLIAAALSLEQLKRFYRTASDLELNCLFEAHNEEELAKILEAEGEIIGINNRDLQTFRENIETTLRLLPLIPNGKTVISESAIKTGEQMAVLQKAGVHGVLVGEAFMRGDIRETAGLLQL